MLESIIFGLAFIGLAIIVYKILKNPMEGLTRADIIKFQSTADSKREGLSKISQMNAALDAIEAMHDNGLDFIKLEDAIKEVQDRRPRKLWLFLENPLNTDGPFFEYIADLISSNTEVSLYVPPEGIDNVLTIRDKLIKEVGRKIVDGFFHYPQRPSPLFLMSNLIIVDPDSEIPAIYVTVRGKLETSIATYRIPFELPYAPQLVKRAQAVWKLDKALEGLIVENTWETPDPIVKVDSNENLEENFKDVLFQLHNPN